MTDKQKKDRDLELVKDVMDWHDSKMPRQETVEAFFLRLSAKYKLKERAIYQILKNNAVTILAHKDYERLKRILKLKREIALKDRSSKDVADLLEQLRKEYEGDKPTVDQSVHIHETYFWKDNGREPADSNRLQSTELPKRDSL